MPRRAAGPRILIHGVSVGEVNALEPLVRALAAAPAAPDVVVSTSTETGAERARRLHEGRREVVRFPLDFRWMVERFLDATSPDLIVLGELELWPSFLRACARRGIPSCVVNGRLSRKSFRGYRAFRPLIGGMFARLALVAAQTERYRERFVTLGVPRERTCVIDSLKWDAARRPPSEGAARRIADALGIDRTRPLVVAGSTGPGEEQALVRDLLKGRGWPPGCQLLLAPRDPGRWDEVAGLVDGMPRRSEAAAGARAADRRAGPFGRAAEPMRTAIHPGRVEAAGRPRVFLLDTIGELAAAYRLADAVFVGRSLALGGRAGRWRAAPRGSNPLEAVALGKPTVIGPHHENFAGVVADLARTGGIAVSAKPDQGDPRMAGRPGGRRAGGRGRAGAGGSGGAGVAARTAKRVLRLL